jgi:acetyl/propionyl-CoA carboxylase alpha subunit
MVLGVDLVAEQLRIAAGEPIGPAARRPVIHGHSIEVRLYSEDPAAGYLPQAGALSRFALTGAEPFAVPRGSRDPADLRLDSGVEDGSVVSPHYDPMLAKVIAWAPSRGEAAARLATALAGAEIDGVVTNRDLLVRILRDEEFLDGGADTGFLERRDGLMEPLVGEADERLHAVAAALTSMAERRESARVLRFAPPGFRNNFSAPQTISFAGDAGECEVTYALRRDGLTLTAGGEDLEAPAVRSLTPDGVELEVGGVARRYRVRRDGDVHHVNGPAGQSSLRELPRFPAGDDALGEGALSAPMPGKVIRLAAAEGDAVEAGDVLVVLEAMKMEHELTAPAAGTVADLRVAEGDQVEAGTALAVIEPSD